MRQYLPNLLLLLLQLDNNDKLLFIYQMTLALVIKSNIEKRKVNPRNEC